MGELFLVMLCNQKEACLLLRLGGVLKGFCIIRGKCFAMFVAIKKRGVKNALIFVEKVPCFNVEQIDNGSRQLHHSLSVCPHCVG